MTNNIIDYKISEINRLEAELREKKALIDSLKTDIKNEMDERKVDCIDTGLNKVFYEAYEKRSVDTKALKAAGLYDQYSKVQVNVLFKISSVTND